jgi:hypothetical protein
VSAAVACAACGASSWRTAERGSPLACTSCGTLWPGCELPEPAHTPEGYGHVAEQAGFSARLRHALAQVPAVGGAA